MKKNSVILLIGACGSGKTWVMKKLINEWGLKINGSMGLIKFKTNKKKCILGKYDGSIFEGSDKLSMAVAKDFDKFKKIADNNGFEIVCEGDRFSNSSFIKVFNPYIIKILDSGLEGRKKRFSNQSERHLKSIQTRVNNIKADLTVKDSDEAFLAIKNIMK
jgi:hypothetical protein